MANKHLTKKLRTYHSLFQINRALLAVQNHCGILEEAGLMPIVKMRIFRDYARELQAQISHDVVDKMHELEDEDMFQFGKTRIAREHYLNPERPALRNQRS